MLKLGEYKSKSTFKLSKYLKPRFTNWLLIFNAIYLLYSITPLTFFQLLPLLIIAATLLKSLKIPWMYTLMLSDPQECATAISNRIDLQLLNFCWLVNKINLHCFCFIFALALILYFTEKWVSLAASWWMFGNLCLLYLGATKVSKGLMKYQLGLYREYKKYVIHVIEPNSPEKEVRKEEESEEEILDLWEK